MKKIIAMLLAMALVFVLGACGGGNVKNAKTHEVPSELYTQQEINAAIEQIKAEFAHNWKGCTLTEIYYAGDKASTDHQEWAQRHNADETLVLLSSFDVAPFGADITLNPGDTYPNWNWILVRNKGGAWRHVDHGY